MLVVWPRLSTLTAVPPLIIAFTCLHVYRFAPESLVWVSHAHANTDAVQLQALPEDRGGGWAITPEIDDYASRALAAEHLPGLSIAVVRITNVGEVEVDMAAWGRMNEDGKQTNVDVCCRDLLSLMSPRTDPQLLSDAVQHRVMFQSLPCCCHRGSDGGLLYGKERHQTPASDDTL